MDRAVSFEDIDSETLLAMDEGFEEAMAAVADEHPKRALERNDSSSKASKENGEPPPKKVKANLVPRVFSPLQFFVRI